MSLISNVAKVPDNINLTDPLTHLRPDIDNIWRQLRNESPVAWHPSVNGQSGFWVVSTHELTMRVYRDRHVEQLVAHYTTHTDHTTHKSTDVEQAIITRVQTLLPSYMWPSQFIQHEQLPLTSSGKVDRRFLMGWKEAERLEEVVSSELSVTEALVAEIWQQILGPFDVVPDADFFCVGRRFVIGYSGYRGS